MPMPQPSSAQIKVACSQCGLKVPVMTMKYGKPGENLLCEKCYAKANPKKSVPVTRDPGAKKYICNHCSFKFFSKKETGKVQCPYCGEANVMLAEMLDADNILKETNSSR